VNILFTPEAWDDYLWFQQNDKAGPLKHNLSGFWSRRISEEHRLVYTVDGDALQIVLCGYHY